MKLTLHHDETFDSLLAASMCHCLGALVRDDAILVRKESGTGGRTKPYIVIRDNDTRRTVPRESVLKFIQVYYRELLSDGHDPEDSASLPPPSQALSPAPQGTQVMTKGAGTAQLAEQMAREREALFPNK